MAECPVGMAYARARRHTLRQGGVGACQARKHNLPFFKWWARWQSIVVALQYAAPCTNPAVITPTILPTWERDKGPSPEPLPVGLASIWGRAMYPEFARVVDTPTRRKSRAPHLAHGKGPQSGGRGH